MCGIMGFVGKSKNASQTYKLATNLLNETQIRGKDATGFYSVSNNDKVSWFKKNIKATDFTQYDPWKRKCPESKILIGHTRLATHGTENDIINNHPHVSNNNKTAIIHNGIIFDYLKIAQEYNINLKSKCDSEIILRLIESETDIILGIKKVFKTCKSGSFACFVASIEKNEKSYYYLFRNQGSPISFIDLKNKLGQYFFCSTQNLWNNIKNYDNTEFIENTNAINIPAFEIWKIDSNNLNIEKHYIEHEIVENKSFYPSYNYKSLLADIQNYNDKKNKRYCIDY